MKRRDFLGTGATAVGSLALNRGAAGAEARKRPNILFCIADDWGWPHAGAYGDPVVKTPNFDRLAREGVLFEHAFVTAPSCTPCRNSILTGQYHWRLEEGANLWSTLNPKFPVYPLLLEEAGYFVGHWRKAWGPGNWKDMGRTKDPAGPTFKGFGDFLSKRPAGKPFCFWLGAFDPHRPYKRQSGANSGIDISKILLPADLPDHETIRHDVADYYFEVQRFDKDVGEAIALLEKSGELDNTIVVMTGDNGMPFPRHKCHLYDSGVHMPMAVRWGSATKGGRRVQDFISFTDLAPTFLDIADAAIPKQMTGKSFRNVLESDKAGQVDPSRDHVLTGRERHVPAQKYPNTGGYPMRAIRTRDYLYIRNFEPDLWPSGVAGDSTHGNSYADCDDSPSKTFILEHREEAKYKKYYDLAFGKRPPEELYDMKTDPDQLINVAADPKRMMAKLALAEKLMAGLKDSGDPRVAGGAEKFATYRYYGRMKKR